MYRIDSGNPKGISHKAPRSRSPSRTYRNIAALRIVDKIRHDQKISGKSHGLYDFKLAIQSLLILAAQLPTSPLENYRHKFFQPISGFFPQVLVKSFSLINLKMGKKGIFKVQGQIASFCNFYRIINGIRTIIKGLLHLFRGLEIKLIRP